MKAEIRTGRTRSAVSAPFPETEPSSSHQALAPLTLSRVLAFSLPALGAALADPLMSLVDTAFVGQVSAIGLAALGPNTAVFGFVSMVFQFFTVSTTAMVSRAHDDRNDVAKKSRCVSDALSLALLCGALCAAALMAFGGHILRLLYTPDELMAPARAYLTIRAAAVPAALVTLVGTAASLGARDARAPLRVAAATSSLNALVNAYLVLGPPGLGIVGSAIGTCLSQYVGAALFVRHMTSKKSELRLRLTAPTWRRAKPFVSSGAALTTRSVCVMTAYSLATAAASAMGTLTVAAHQVLVGVVTVAQFCPEPLSACAQSELASVASKRGSNGRFGKHTQTRAERRFAKRSARLLLCCGGALGGGVAGLCYVALVRFPHVFSADVHVAMAVAAMAPIVCVAVFAYALVCVMDGLIFASGRMMFAAGASIANLPLAAAFVARASGGGFGLMGTWYALLALFLVRLVENGIAVGVDYGVFEWDGKETSKASRRR